MGRVILAGRVNRPAAGRRLWRRGGRRGRRTGSGRAGRPAGQPGEVGEDVRDDLPPARILPLGGLGEDGDQVARLLGRLLPGRRGRGEEVPLQLRLALLQGRPLGLDLGAEPADLGRLLGGHAAVLVEHDRRIVAHVGPSSPASSPETSTSRLSRSRTSRSSAWRSMARSESASWPAATTSSTCTRYLVRVHSARSIIASSSRSACRRSTGILPDIGRPSPGEAGPFPPQKNRSSTVMVSPGMRTWSPPTWTPAASPRLRRNSPCLAR